MNKVEVNEIAGTLTQPQRDVLLMLDGRLSNLELNGTYSRVVKALSEKGLVAFRKGTRQILIRGPYDKGRVVYHVQLTDRGGDFIYNGGLDR
jgi:DNA-binding MarR family transcriptional regulator